MDSEKQRLWTREELLSVLALYFRIPFGRMHQGNPDVVALAKAIGRTVGAVAFKLVNFASMDPELKERGVGGMRNASKLDHEIWGEFYGKWEMLAEADVSLVEVPEIQKPVVPPADIATDYVGEVVQRRGQNYFRSIVLAAYEGKCCITGIATPELLRASHIIPWAADKTRRLDPTNGLCLNALHDAAFDRGLITFTDGMELVLSKHLSDSMPSDSFAELFEKHAGRPARRPERLVPSVQGLTFHRSNIFRR